MNIKNLLLKTYEARPLTAYTDADAQQTARTEVRPKPQTDIIEA